MNRTIMILFLVCSFLFVFYTASALEIKIPVTTDFEKRDDYQIGLLRLVLSKTSTRYTISLLNLNFSQSRIIDELTRGSDLINLYWMGTSAELEQNLLPIRYPVSRGCSAAEFL